MAIMGERGYSTLRILKHKILESLEVRKKVDASVMELKSVSSCLHILKPQTYDIQEYVCLIGWENFKERMLPTCAAWIYHAK